MNTTATPSFQNFALSEDLFQAINEAGFTAPTPIQSAVIPYILSENDVIAKAQTGSGKTAAFCLPALELLSASPEKTILIMTPTRELALQVCSDMHQFSKNQGITPTAIYGGEAISNQLKRLRKDSRIIVGTPGRLLDLFRSGHLKKFAPQLVVLDEADEMLKMGFLEDIQSIFSFLPKERQTLLFSATISQPIKKISKQFLTNPKFCDQSSKDLPHEDIHQIYYLVSERQRQLALVQLLSYHAPTKALVFCNTKRQVEELSGKLTSLGFSILCLHGDMSQKERQNSIERFRCSSKMILVATDVAGRGIHVTDITHVFNFEIPFSLDNYTHRIGRTGRMGNKGTAITLISPKQTFYFKKFLGKNSQVKFTDLPTPDDINYKQQKQFSESIDQEEVHNNAEKILQSLQEKHTLEEISLRLISKYWRKVANTQAEKLEILTPSNKKNFSSKKKPFDKKRSFNKNRRSNNKGPFKKSKPFRSHR